MADLYELALDMKQSSVEDEARRMREEEAQRRADTARLAIAEDRDPDQEAQVYDMSRRTLTPPDLTRETLPELKRQEHIRALDLPRLVKESPVIGKELSDPAVAGFIHDDTSNLSWWERIAKDTTQKWAATQRNLAISDVGWADMWGQAGDADLNRADDLESQNANLEDYRLPRPLSWVPEGVGQIPFMLRAMSESADETLTGAVGGAGVGYATGGPVGAAVGARLGMAAGFKTGVTIETGKIEAGLAFREFKAMRSVDGLPMDKDAAKVAAVVVGAVNGLVETVLIDKLLRTIPGADKVLGSLSREGMKALLKVPSVRDSFSRIGKAYGEAAVAGLLEEAVQELSVIIGGNVLAELQEAEFETTGFAEALRRTGEAAEMGLGAALVLGAPGTVASLGLEMRYVKEAGDRRDAFIEMGKKAAESKTRQRLPQKFQEIVKKVQDQYESVEDVYVDAGTLNRFFQDSGVTPEVVAKDMPVLSQRLTEALELGTDVAIPMDEFATYIAPSEAFEQLASDLRMHPEALTAREAEQMTAEHQQVLEAYREMADRMDAAEVAQDSVYEDIRAQLEQAGNAPEIADKQAQLWSNVFRVQGLRTGTDPFELYKRFNVMVNREGLQAPGKGDVSSLDSHLNALREGKFPSQGEMFGRTLAEHIRQRGGLREMGGKLANRDIDKALPGLRRNEGMSFDDALESAVQEGYFPGRSLGDLTEQDLLDALDAEIRGEPVYAMGQENQQAIELNASLNDLGRALDDAGIDVNLPNEQILEQLTTLSQEQLGDGKRGFITFPEGREWFRITLSGKANLSTFLHESGHFYLEMLQVLAEEHPAIARDLETVRKWVGSDGGKFTTEQHEQFARGFEAYLMEGKSPSGEMRDLFQKFKAWLTHIYRQMKALGVELTPEVRGVFDRLVASEEEIAQAAQMAGLVPMLEQSDMSPVQYAAYMGAYSKAMAEAQEKVDAEMIDEIRKRQADEYREAREGVLAEMEAAWNKRQDANAREFLRTGSFIEGDTPEAIKGWKLNTGALKNLYPGGEVTKRLVGMHSREGVHPDLVAEALGYGTGEQLISALMTMPQKREWIGFETDKAMAAKYPPMDMAEAAAKAVHSDPVARFLLAELKMAGGRSPSLAIVKQAAREAVRRLSMMDLKPQRYRAAELKWGREAQKHVALKNLQAAADAKRKQLMNHYMYREAMQAAEEVDSIRAYLSKFDRRSVRETIGKAAGDDYSYLEAIDTLLDGVELRRSTSFRSIARRGALQEFIQREEAAGRVVAIPDRLRNESALRSYKQMSVDELEALRDAVKNIEHLARTKNKMTTAQWKRNYFEVVDGILANFAANLTPKKKGSTRNPTWWDKKKRFAQAGNALLTKVEFLALWADGGKPGFVHEHIYQPFADAQAREYDMLKEYGKPIIDMIKGMPAAQRARLQSSDYIGGVKYAGHEIMAIALNMGNASNKQKMLDGEGWTESEVWDVLNRNLRKEDWDMVQAIWDGMERLWPETERLHKRTTGIAPPKVERTPVQTPWGEYAGGYYPMVYDPERTPRVERHAEASDLFANNFLRPNVSRGFTEARTKYSAPLLFSLDVIPQHLNEVIHYLTHYEAVTNVNRLLNDTRIVNGIRDFFGPEYVKQMRQWLKNIANDRNNLVPFTVYDKVFRHLRIGTSVVAMGFKYWTGIAQTLGLFTTVDAIGMKWTLRGFTEVMRHPVDTWRKVDEMSGEMRHIAKTFDREIKATLDGFTAQGRLGKASTLNQDVVRLAFMHISYIQKAVNLVTWVGAFQQYQAENPGADEAAAVRYADSVMRTTQSAGGAKDLAGVQMGHEGLRLLTAFYTYFSVLYNRERQMFQNMKRIGDLPKAAASFLWLVAMPVVVESMIKGDVPEDEDEWAEWFFIQSMLYSTTSVPFMRDLANGALTQYGYKFSPSAGLLESAIRAGKKASEGDFDDVFWRNLVKASGGFLHLPTDQPYRTFEYLMAGEAERPVRDFLVGPKRD